MGKQPEDTEAAAHDNDEITHATSAFRLVGYSNFIRSNPRSDRFPVFRFHHIEFWTSDATNACRRFSWGLGMPIVAKSDLSTGNSLHASYLLQSSHLRFLFSAPYSQNPNYPQNHDPAPAIPSFSVPAAHSFIAAHGLAVRAVAVKVADAGDAFHASLAHGAVPAAEPVELGRGCRMSEVRLYGDVVLRYVSFGEEEESELEELGFLPGFEKVEESYPLDFGIRRLDHAVGNVTSLAEAVEYVKGFTGFHEFAEFTAEDVGTAESGLNSVVLANNDEMVLLPMNEPVFVPPRRVSKALRSKGELSASRRLVAVNHDHQLLASTLVHQSEETLVAAVVADEVHQEVATVTDMTTDEVAAMAVVDAMTTVAVPLEVMMTAMSDAATVAVDVTETIATEAVGALTDTKAAVAAADGTTTQPAAVSEEVEVTTESDVKNANVVMPLAPLHATMHHLESRTVAVLEESMAATTDMPGDKHLVQQIA